MTESERDRNIIINTNLDMADCCKRDHFVLLSGVHGDTQESVRVGLWQVGGREHSRVEHLFGQDVPEEGDVVGDSSDDVVIQSIDRGSDSVLSSRAIAGQLE